MAFNIRVLVICILLVLVGCGSDPQAEELSLRWAKHDWTKNRPELLVDIDQDGIKERALMGSGDKTIIVAVYRQSNVNVIDFVEIFTNKPSQQNAICGSKASLSLEKQNYSLAETHGANPEGFKSCKSCEGLLLEDKKGCAPFHIYWDHNSQQLTWWRS